MTMATDSQALEPIQHNPVENYSHDATGGISNPVLGMLLFITSEVMFFAGLFAAYFNLRANISPWPPVEFAKILQPIGIHNGIPFTTENGDLNLILPATLILIASSFTCQFGVWGIRQNDRKALVRNIGVTMVLGITFLLMQVYDYSVLLSEGLTLASGPF